MDIHEYQAKQILQRYGIPVPRGGLAYSPEQAAYRCSEIGGSAWVVKAQVHAGDRAASGGVTVCRSAGEVSHAAAELFGTHLVSRRSLAGNLVYRISVEEAVDIARELSLRIVLDHASETVRVVASADGAVALAELAARAPEAIVRTVVEPAVGITDFQTREIAFGVGLEPSRIADATRVIRGAYRAFTDLDATMLEIDPLVVTRDGSLVAVDARMSFDDNALFRHPEIAELRDRSQEDAREAHAADRGLTYVGLDGDIGCLVNDPGLAMATLDLVALAGGEAANVVDLGGGARPERVVKAFRAVLRAGTVRAVLVNVFGGVHRCDQVAEGVVTACRALSVSVPVVVRLAGTHLDEGRRILATSGLPVRTADSAAGAARLVVDAARSGALR